MAFLYAFYWISWKFQLGYKRRVCLLLIASCIKYNHVCALEGIRFNFRLFMPLHAVPVFSFCATLRLQSSAHVLITSVRPCVTLMLVCLYGQEVVSYASAEALYYVFLRAACDRKSVRDPSAPIPIHSPSSCNKLNLCNLRLIISHRPNLLLNIHTINREIICSESAACCIVRGGMRSKRRHCFLSWYIYILDILFALAPCVQAPPEIGTKDGLLCYKVCAVPRNEKRPLAARELIWLSMTSLNCEHVSTLYSMKSVNELENHHFPIATSSFPAWIQNENAALDYSETSQCAIT